MWMQSSASNFIGFFVFFCAYPNSPELELYLQWLWNCKVNIAIKEPNLYFSTKVWRCVAFKTRCAGCFFPSSVCLKIANDSFILNCTYLHFSFDFIVIVTIVSYSILKMETFHKFMARWLLHLMCIHFHKTKPNQTEKKRTNITRINDKI